MESGATVSDELLQAMFNAAHDYAIFSVNPMGMVTSWNAGSQRLLGWAPEEIMGLTADVIFTTEDRAAQIPEKERSSATRDGRAQDDRWQVRKDGSRFWASGLLMPFDEPTRGYIKILRDRTAQHLAEERLKESEERFRLLAVNIPQLVFRSRSDGYRTWPSPQWISYTGVDAAHSFGFGWLDAIHPDDRPVTVAGWDSARVTGEYSVEHRVRRSSDAQYRWHQTRARPVDKGALDDGDWVGTTTDVHDIRSLQERQIVMMAELQHRTRNLLALVQAIAAQTLRKTRSVPEFQCEFESRLQALGRVMALISGVDYAAVDLRDLLTAELQAYGSGVLEKGKVRLDGPALPLKPAAAQALGLALHELTTNAAKYGALAQENATIAVTWRLEGAAAHTQAIIEWKESSVKMEPTSSDERPYGYGRELIERALPYQLGANTVLSFEDDGVRCRIRVDLSEKAKQERAASAR
jgi:PAS domain S-box-containing protein